MANPETGHAAEVTQAVQDYLKAIYHLRTPQGAVATHDIAASLTVSAASVTKMVKRLAEQGLLRHTPYQGVQLTKTGERVALEIIRHHRLLELYLCKLLGVSWDKVHTEAERLEHVLSEELEERLAELLGEPTQDPHGSPIPTKDLRMPATAGQPLSTLAAGMSGVVAEVPDDDADLLRYLDGMGLRPGVVVGVQSVAPFDGPLTLAVGNATHAVGRAVCAQVRVSVKAGPAREAGPNE